MASNYIPAPFGYKTYAFLSECAACGKPYANRTFNPEDVWRTAYTCHEETHTGMWLLYCLDCYEELEVVGE